MVSYDTIPYLSMYIRYSLYLRYRSIYVKSKEGLPKIRFQGYVNLDKLVFTKSRSVFKKSPGHSAIDILVKWTCKDVKPSPRSS